MTFIQIVEYETERADEIATLMGPGTQPAGQPGYDRVAVGHDRDNPRRYMMVVEFPSYEDAMANSKRPETDAMARRLAQLCTSGPRYHNLDVVHAEP